MTHKSFLRFMAVSALLMSPLAGGAVFATPWNMLPEESTVRFAALQTGNPFEGTFNTFDTDIRFDPSAPGQAYVRAVIDAASAVTGDSQRDEALRGREWLHIARFRDIVFEASGFKKLGDSKYEAEGTLTVLGVDHSFTLPFDLVVVQERAVMSSSLILNRRTLGIGTGPWSEGKWVSLDVTLDIIVTATKETP